MNNKTELERLRAFLDRLESRLYREVNPAARTTLVDQRSECFKAIGALSLPPKGRLA